MASVKVSDVKQLLEVQGMAKIEADLANPGVPTQASTLASWTLPDGSPSQKQVPAEPAEPSSPTEMEA